MKRVGFCAILFLLALTGCNKPATPPPPPAAAYSGLPTAAQPTLPTIKLWVGGKALTAEKALTDVQEHTGMMFRTSNPPDHGMIFVYPEPQQVAFWMMNCPLPLDAAYLDANGTILELHDLEPFNTNSVISSAMNIQYVIETSRGWFKSNGIGVGTVVATEKGPLSSTFFGQH